MGRRQYQSVVYEGYLANDPEYRFTPNGGKVINLVILSNYSYPDKKEESGFANELTRLEATVWGDAAEALDRQCMKGTHVLFEGRLKPGSTGSPETYPLKNGNYAASYKAVGKVHVLGRARPNPNAQPNDTSESVDDSSQLPYD